ncbi:MULTISPECIES: hypothetical protein [Selenomonas]|jgi:hypothetical protein|uniref:hypothetical protein n=1 Tax=Selenomonas TaxID=970 RepID=UPI0001EB2BF7|nr:MULTISPECIES: hypothetical protein [Selenomonas]EFR40733.1 hypothetical protein HMPREF9162_2194 [Selenomonas sp. oral taxon 137 str. F0430]
MQIELTVNGTSVFRAEKSAMHENGRVWYNRDAVLSIRADHEMLHAELTGGVEMPKDMEQLERERLAFEEKYGVMREPGQLLPEEERVLCTPEEELDDEDREILRMLQTEIPNPIEEANDHE